MLTEGTNYKGSYRDTGRLPRGCTDDQAQRLVRGGYLERITIPTVSGKQVVHYSVTGKGQAAWRAYRFDGS
jgi:hypothetical protein